MRLGQLARQLGIRPPEIVEFLGANQILIDEGSNTRLTDLQTDLITERFAPQPDGKLTEVPIPAVNKEVADISEGYQDQEAEGPNNKPAAEPDPQINEPIDVIKAPKIELSGLKVLGKIELPEPKKTGTTSEVPIEPAGGESNDDRRKDRNVTRGRKQRQQSPRKNPIAVEREREAEALKRKREDQAALDKQKKTQSYLKKVKMSPPTKAVRIVDEPVMQMTADELRERPTSWLGRVIEWLTHA